MRRAFDLRAALDPGRDHLATLAAYPARPLWPDFAVLTSGRLAIELDGRAVAYADGVLVDRPAGGRRAAWLTDYLGGYLPRLADALLTLRPGAPTEARLLDAPGRLAFEQGESGMVTITYRDADGGRLAASVPLAAAQAVAVAALATFLADLLAVNARLADHEQVIDLRRQLAALAVADDPVTPDRARGGA